MNEQRSYFDQKCDAVLCACKVLDMSVPDFIFYAKAAIYRAKKYGDRGQIREERWAPQIRQILANFIYRRDNVPKVDPHCSDK